MSDNNSTETNLRNWLLGMGFSISQVQQQDPNVEFNLGIANAFGTGIAINVVKLRNQPMIMTGLGIGIDPIHKQAFSELGNREKSDYLFEIQKNLLFLGVDFNFVPNATDPQQIQINHSIYVEDITRTSLMASLKTVRNAGLYLIWSYRNKFTTEMGSSSSPTVYG